jgi:hypothetical protein
MSETGTQTATEASASNPTNPTGEVTGSANGVSPATGTEGTATPDAPKKRTRTNKPKTDYRGAPELYDENGKLKAIPGDFKKSNNPLKQTDFATPALFLEFKASRLEAAAASLRKQAASLGKFKTQEEQKAAASIGKAYEKLLECRDTLRKGGMGDDEISKILGVDIAAIAAKQAGEVANAAPAEASAPAPEAPKGKAKK